MMEGPQFHRFEDRRHHSHGDLVPGLSMEADRILGWVEDAREMPPLPVVRLPSYRGPQDPAEFLQPKHDGDAGIDLHTPVNVVLEPQSRVLVPTGLMMAIPKKYYGAITPRSGYAIKAGLTILNTPGVIDSPYRGEIGVILFNSAPLMTHGAVDLLLAVLHRNEDPIVLQERIDADYAANTISFRAGQSIAQMVFHRYYTPREIMVVESLEETARGSGGFGSTG